MEVEGLEFADAVEKTLVREIAQHMAMQMPSVGIEQGRRERHQRGHSIPAGSLPVCGLMLRPNDRCQPMRQRIHTSNQRREEEARMKIRPERRYERDNRERASTALKVQNEPNQEKPATIAFNKKFLRIHGRDPSNYSSMGYELMLILGNQLKKNGVYFQETIANSPVPGFQTERVS